VKLYTDDSELGCAEARIVANWILLGTVFACVWQMVLKKSGSCR